MLRLVLLIALIIPPFATLHARTWKNSTGTEIEAELKGIEGTTALFIKDGRIFKVPVSTLSAADQEFIRAWKPEAGESSTPPEAEGTLIPKKGCCLSLNTHPDWPARLKALNADWFYIWNSEKPDGIPEGIEFVPMVFGKPDRIDPSVDYLKASQPMSPFRFLLGYNEPDQADQSNMTVEAALEAWPKLMSVGLPLISPAAAKPEGEWMEQFMDGIEKGGLRVDFIAIHSYGGSNPDAFLDMLERVHRKYDRPLWITEFAVGDWDAKNVSENRHSVKAIKDFMRKVLPKLERLDYVYRYAWFQASPSDPHLGTSALFNEDGSLTELGEFYSKQ